MLIYQILEYLFYTVFFLSSLLLIVVVLLQEGKGGGIAEAFGGVGGETFGVRASGIARFTGWVAFTFMATAILIPITTRQIANERNPYSLKQEAPPDPGKGEDQKPK